ncbi:NUDIX domain-containing protein [Microbacterium sp. ABRD28]|uniref:NUDIX domain-containing protein n=1 Tax=Microbacterium sp. ABRD28 TaxID=2268461 RepID=UPI000F54F87B|nr:NUDIX domain-containing protein [Microbacterium sp. ABRD28]AZC13109.1 NUDIX domain-containing protein [Microbacterium sp. ABRD28]
MPASDYIQSLRSRIGHDLLLLPGVTAVIRDGERMLLVRHAHSGTWSLVGGAVEPGEEPLEAVMREVREELDAEIDVTGIVGVYGGEPLMVTYPNGDRVGYVTTAYECVLRTPPTPDGVELVEIGWFARRDIASLDRRGWIDRVLADVRG